MMSTSSKTYISINEFWHELLELQTGRFSGTIELDEPSGQNWKMYFYLGRLLYATGGKHPVRRWVRQVKAFAPQITLKEDNLWTQEKEFKICWEYELLSQWNLEGKIEKEQVRKVIQGVIQEVFFDLHRMRVSQPKITEEEISFSQQWTLTSLEEYINHSRKEWKNWQKKGIADLDPEKRPIIARTEDLIARVPAKVYENMVKFLSTESTLWELAEKIK